MSQWISFGGGGGAVANLNTTYEEAGFGAGDGTLISTTSPAHTKGAYVQLTASTANDWAGFWVSLATGSAASARFLFDISFDGGSTVAVPNVYTLPGGPFSSGQSALFFLPMNVPAGANIQVRAQSGVASQTFRIALLGVVRNSDSRPLFNTCTAISAADTAGTQPGTTAIPLTDTWTEMNPSTSATYGAIFANFGASTSPATSQAIGIAIGRGAAASEVEMVRTISGFSSTSPTLRGVSGFMVETSVASGTRICCRAYGATPGSDAIVGQLFGFS
ncbi:MAG: hypothetical protein JSS57_21470 [Proteobacteria bacterium]|nr:hypothetical protein [Pseudomonadota bacterium]